jgi:hypothetical protein
MLTLIEHRWLHHARESCADDACTLPEDSINGDRIQVVRQEGGPQDDGGIEAVINARQERREAGNAAKAKELDEGHHPVEHT